MSSSAVMDAGICNDKGEEINLPCPLPPHPCCVIQGLSPPLSGPSGVLGCRGLSLSGPDEMGGEAGKRQAKHSPDARPKPSFLWDGSSVPPAI